jgi:hypothetical protein
MALVADEQMGEEGQLSSCERCEGGGIASRRGGGEGEWHALKFEFKTKTITHLNQFCGAAHESVTLRSCCSSLSL